MAPLSGINCCGTCKYGFTHVPHRVHVDCRYHDIQATFYNCCDNQEPKKDLYPDVITKAVEVTKAYLFLREHDHEIPTETLEYIKDTCLRDLAKQAVAPR